MSKTESTRPETSVVAKDQKSDNVVDFAAVKVRRALNTTAAETRSIERETVEQSAAAAARQVFLTTSP